MVIDIALIVGLGISFGPLLSFNFNSSIYTYRSKAILLSVNVVSRKLVMNVAKKKL